jgi:hypothetical protein
MEGSPAAESPDPVRSPFCRHPALPVALAWLLPGAGHMTIGRAWPGIFVAGAVWPLFAGGMILAGFGNVSWERHPWLFGVQVLAGVPAGAAALLTRSVVVREFHAHHTVGDLFTCVAGLLNLVAVADVWARCVDGDPEERLARKLASEAAAAEDERRGAASLVRDDARDAAGSAP